MLLQAVHRFPGPGIQFKSTETQDWRPPQPMNGEKASMGPIEKSKGHDARGRRKMSLPPRCARRGIIAIESGIPSTSIPVNYPTGLSWQKHVTWISSAGIQFGPTRLWHGAKHEEDVEIYVYGYSRGIH